MTAIDKEELPRMKKASISRQGGGWSPGAEGQLEPAGTSDLALALTPSRMSLSQESHLISRLYERMLGKAGKTRKAYHHLCLLNKGHVNLQ